MSLAEVFGADGGLRWFFMRWAPDVREVWDRRTFAEVIRAAEAVGWAPDSGASRRPWRASITRRCRIKTPLHGRRPCPVRARR